MNDDGDTCNMSHIMRLQVENSTENAIYVSPNTLSCVIDNIHSEGAIGVPVIETASPGVCCEGLLSEDGLLGVPSAVMVPGATG